jgi:hypothetical protein
MFSQSQYSSCPRLPQVAETNTPRLMDVTGECLLYHMICENNGSMEDSQFILFMRRRI